MGFQSSEWAYSVLNLTAPERAVLVALAHCRNDKTGACFPGQETLVGMTGLSEKTVRRALAALESREAPVIARQQRFAGRYRTSDSYTLLFDNHRSERPPVTVTTGQPDHRSDSPRPPVTVSPTTGHTDHPIEEEQEAEHEAEHEESSSTSPSEIEISFERAYASWPKKAERQESLKSFTKVAKVRGLDAVVADVIRFGQAYAASGRDRQYVPALCVWLNRGRWTDDLPAQAVPTESQWASFVSDRPTPMDRATQTLGSGRMVAGRMVTSLDPPHECFEHRWLPDGTCNFCTAKREQLSIRGAA